MEKIERRKTKVYAHCNKERVVSAFCDTYESEKLVVEDLTGTPILRTDYYASSEKDATIKLLAEKLGYSWHIEVESKIYDGYALFKVEMDDGKFKTLNYQVFDVSPRKCYILISTNPAFVDEAEHYARVDGVIKALACKGIGILEGQCEVTVTTRC